MSEKSVYTFTNNKNHTLFKKGNNLHSHCGFTKDCLWILQRGGGAEICPYQRQKEEQIKPKTRVRSLKLVRKKKLFYKSRDNAKNDNAKKKTCRKGEK